MATPPIPENRGLRLALPNALKGFLMRAQVDERLGRLSETTIEFRAPDLDLDLGKLVGERMRLEIDAPNGRTRYFQGHCVAAEYLGAHAGAGYFRAEVRPWLWFLTRSANSRIFQDKTVIEVIAAVFGGYDVSDHRVATNRKFKPRDYCVQYRESDFDFVSRLMEEEGIYYFFEHDRTRETLVLADDAGAHRVLTDHPSLDFHFQEAEYRRADDHVFEWRGIERVQTGKVALHAYDPERPSSDLAVRKSAPRGLHRFRNYEVYAPAGRHREPQAGEQEGEHQARVMVEGFAAAALRVQGACNVRQMATGGRFKLREHPRKAENREYLVIAARHRMQIEVEGAERELVHAILGPALDFGEGRNRDRYRCTFEAQPANEPYRSRRETPRPEIPGVQTAVVVGKKDEDVWTDEHGRVKVLFHWDREGGKDEHASCWVRAASPWSGKGWGFVGLPRLGQEVVVQFEDGDPDRPLVTGMVYNGESRVPWPLPANRTRSGIRTRSSDKGTGFHELVFEDRKDAEFVRLQSERDFTQIVKNNAEITVGLGHKTPGTFKQTIHGDKTERIVEGNHRFAVEKGEEAVSIAKTRTTEIGADDVLTVDGDRRATVKGAARETVSKSMELDVGTTLELSAKTKIVLKCGASKLEITPSKVSISSPQVEVAASGTATVSASGQLSLEGKGMAALKGGGMLQLEGGFAQLKSSGLLMAKGAITLIN
ncbi:type VI secretion system Vgr family protein [Albimonas pacifica]|uniref:Type VI secretion system secreted protein VgrG n=1 Tax=Albimonas pacifica TaxID=1114924 RepID=A0A1I3CZP0_9RHOB|nr:type VI secretion system tip protein TssI/VgrG [Albimonas pacifica]SFH79838.1 type VI secretion system secreted protein VgrG [Albimonas pacifica]